MDRGLVGRPSHGRHRFGLASRLRDRRPEIDQAVLTRVYGVSDPSDRAALDPGYEAGLRAAVAAALDYGLAGIEGEGRLPPIPAELFSQARHAARSSVSLDTVLRRYFAGYALLGDFIVEEAERLGSLQGAELQSLLRAQAALLDRLLVAISSEYEREAAERLRSTEDRRAERARRLLAGDLPDVGRLDYELDAWHLGMVATGPGAAEAVRELAAGFDRRLHLVRPGAETIWAWLGGRRRVGAGEVMRLASDSCPVGVSLAIGEAGQGLGGWRLTHRQASAALPIALYGSEGPVRYADVALLASVLTDDVLVSSLKEMYLAPLECEHDEGAVLRHTVKAYLAAGRNVSSAAASLGVSRPTVKSRLRTVEERIERSIDSCSAELQTALKLQEMARAAPLRLQFQNPS